MSCPKVCHPIVENWSPIPDVNSHCVQEVAKWIVEEFNKKSEYKLKFVCIYEGWYLELGHNIMRYKHHIKAVDIFERTLNYEAIVHEEKPHKERIRKLESITILVTPGHHVGNVPPPPVLKWIEIKDLSLPIVPVVAKFSVEEFNRKTVDSLKYVNTYVAWYAEIGRDDLKFRLHMKVKDCIGRVRSYEVVVLVEHFLIPNAKMILISFKMLENWVQIPDVKEHCVIVVAKFAVDQFNIRYKNSWKFESVYEGWYVEVGPNNLKYRLLIKVLDIIGRLLDFEAIVVEEKPHGERIRILVTFTPIAGHPIDPNKWIQISNLNNPFVVEIAKFALEYIKNDTGDNLYFDVIFGVWYRELGGDDLEFRIHMKTKDCLGRFHKFEAIVKIKNFSTENIKVFVSYKCICA